MIGAPEAMTGRTLSVISESGCRPHPSPRHHDQRKPGLDRNLTKPRIEPLRCITRLHSGAKIMAVEDLLHPLLSTYLGAPRWVKNSLGRAYSTLPVSLRYGRHYWRFLREAAWQPEAALRRLAARKLACTLRHALLTVPAYREYRELAGRLGDDGEAGHDRCEEVLRALPLVSKDDIRRDPRRYMSTAVDRELAMKVFTGGSTAAPMTFHLHKGVTRAKEHAYMEQFHRRAGLGRRGLTLSMRGHAVPGASAQDARSRLWMHEPIKRQLILSSDHLARACMPRYLEAMRAWKPRFIQAYPSTIYPLALWLAEHPAADATGRIEGIMLFSESVLDHHMAAIRAVFSCPVLKHYGHSERVLMAASMPDDERYFFWPQYGRLELVDHAGAPVTQPGVAGEIVGTGFDNGVMPLLRYRTGDMAALGGSPHPLLPAFPVVERIEGRMQEFIVCRDRRLVSVNSLTEIPRDPGLEGMEAIQFEQRIPGRIVARVAAPPGIREAALQRFAHALEGKTQHGCEVEVMRVDRIARTARGKLRMLIQHLDTRGYFGAH
jgi:phenylacetate-CoA ligase